MPSRVIPFVNNEYYHVFNRGVMQMPIFNNDWEYQRFTKTMLYYQISDPKPRFSLFSPSKTILNPDQKIVNIICYCLMPNHFHFLLQQLRENGITEFLSKLSNSYTKYINIKDKRVGPLFQGEFKSVHIETNEQLLHISRYVHLNPLVGYKTKELEEYEWSSYPEYLGIIQDNICEKEIILSQFKSIDDYKNFALDYKDYENKLEFFRHQLLDFPQV